MTHFADASRQGAARIPRVLYCTNIPTPYRVAFFDDLGKYVDLTAIYELRRATDRNPAWTAPAPISFREVYLAGIRTGRDASLCPSILRHLERFDLIILGGYSTPTQILAINYLSLRRIPFILNSDGGFIKNDAKLVSCLKRYLISRASGWLGTGAETAKYLIHYGADPNRIHTYPFSSVRDNDVEESVPGGTKKLSVRRELSISERYCVLSVGRMLPSKGFDVLIKAAAQLGREIGVYIVGGDPLPEYVELRDSLGAVNVHFVGFKGANELAQYYTAADLFVLPTRSDVWGLVINEAMAHGLPVVTTTHCIAGTEMVCNGVHGFVIPPDDIAELVESIERIVLDESVRIRMASDALVRAREYTIERMARSHANAIKGFFQ